MKNYKTGIGKWNLTAEAIEKAYKAPSAQPAVEASYVPSKDETFTKFGSFDSIQKLSVQLFYPAFITGLSGNGKTLCRASTCSPERELIRVNITIETDEDDLIGGFRLLTVLLYGTTVL